jgi:biopolymer transport protein TolR
MITHSGNNRFMSDINVTPFVDVMLVLLVIFMVAAPLFQQGVDVDLPRAAAKNLAAQEEHLTLSITKDKKVFINQIEMDRENLKDRLMQIFGQRTDKELFFRADKDLPYGFVMQVMAEIKEAGIERLGMMTAPLEK